MRNEVYMLRDNIMAKRLLLGFSAIFLLTLGGIGITANALYHKITPNCSCPPPEVWQIQDQLSFKNADGLFSLERIVITPQEFHFFYVFQFREPGNIHVVVNSHAVNHPQSTASHLAVTAQTLGQLGLYTIGVLHVQRKSYVGQTLTLLITPPGENRSPWFLTPLDQVGKEIHENTAYYDFYAGIGSLNEVTWHVLSQQESYLEYIPSGQTKMVPVYLFLKTEGPFVVTVITRSEYLSVAGSL